MMTKAYTLFIATLLLACNSGEDVNTSTTQNFDSGKSTVDSIVVNTDSANNSPAEKKERPSAVKDTVTSKNYTNQRFRNVQVKKTGEHTFVISGQAQVFEAAFSWVVEDGHNELKQGHEMTHAGAPAWGNFKFTVDVQKQNPNSTLHLILFEASAKDGSRQHQLAIPLY